MSHRNSRLTNGEYFLSSSILQYSFSYVLNTSTLLPNENFTYSHRSVVFLRQCHKLILLPTMVAQKWDYQQNFKYGFQSLLWCMSIRSIKTGGFAISLCISFRFLYVVSVKEIFSLNILNVGSTANTKNSTGLMQNSSSSNNSWSCARIQFCDFP